MLIIFSVLLIHIGLIKRQSKILFYIIWILLLLLFGGSTENADRIAYMNNYEQSTFGAFDAPFEYGFQLLCQIGSFLGLSYDQFLFVIALIGLALIASTIKLYAGNSSYTLSLYSIYPFVLDTVQIRNFAAMSIIIYGSRYILSHKKEYIKYIISILLASSVHVSALFYFSGLIVAFKNTKKLFTIVVVAAISSIFLIPIILPYLTVITSIEKIEAYTLTETSMFTKVGIIAYFAYFISLLLIARNILNRVQREDNAPSQSKFVQIDPEAVLKINIICIPILYLMIDNLNFFRVCRNIMVINYILFALCLSKMKRSIMYYVFFWCILILAVASFIIFIVVAPVTNIVDPLFENNAFF